MANCIIQRASRTLVPAREAARRRSQQVVLDAHRADTLVALQTAVEMSTVRILLTRGGRHNKYMPVAKATFTPSTRAVLGIHVLSADDAVATLFNTYNDIVSRRNAALDNAMRKQSDVAVTGLYSRFSEGCTAKT